jgi:hypothetical protein
MAAISSYIESICLFRFSKQTVALKLTLLYIKTSEEAFMFVTMEKAREQVKNLSEIEESYFLMLWQDVQLFYARVNPRHEMQKIITKGGTDA